LGSFRDARTLGWQAIDNDPTRKMASFRRDPNRGKWVRFVARFAEARPIQIAKEQAELQARLAASIVGGFGLGDRMKLLNKVVLSGGSACKIWRRFWLDLIGFEIAWNTDP
jgi:hypothetical protein